MVIIKGYKCAGSDFSTIEESINKLQELIQIQGAKLYTVMLASEIETLVDDIALNIVPRPQISIYAAARKNLDQRISDATGRGLLLPYNFGIQLAVFTYKNEVYIRMNTNNERLVNSLKRAPIGLTDYCVHDDRPDDPEEKNREATWHEIMTIYSGGRSPVIRQFMACDGASPTWKKISEKFQSRAERAEKRIRHQQTNRLLNMISMNQQIPPHKLMPYLDEALTYLSDQTVRADARQMMPQAMQTIVNITEEMVMRDPNATVPPASAIT